MSAPSLAVAVLAGVLLAACAARPPDRIGGDSPVRVEGTVSVVGSPPLNVRIVLQPRDGSPAWRLEGEAAAEVARLTGFLVTVEGEPTEASPPEARALRVLRYEAASPWGSVLLFGEVERVDGPDVVLRGDDGRRRRVRLPEGAVGPGQRVWVEPTDPAAPEPLRVMRYGVLRP